MYCDIMVEVDYSPEFLIQYDVHYLERRVCAYVNSWDHCEVWGVGVSGRVLVGVRHHFGVLSFCESGVYELPFWGGGAASDVSAISGVVISCSADLVVPRFLYEE